MEEKLNSDPVLLSPRPARESNGFEVLGIAALLNGLLFGVVLGLGTPANETNDDLVMQLLASGFYTGEPSEYLVFTNVIIGWALKGLYRVWTGPNWYFVYLVAVHYVSLTAIAYVILGRGRRWLPVILYTAFFLLVEPRNLLSLQFTTTAFTAGTAGVFLLAKGLEFGSGVHVLEVIGGLSFLLLAVMVREQVVPLLLLLAGPFLVERFRLKGWRRAVSAGIAGTALLLVVIGINRWYYQRNQAWAEFVEYNTVRGRIQLTPLARLIPEAARAAGWTENDGRMFAAFYFPDPEVYLPSSKLRALYERLHTLSEHQPSPRRLSVADLFLPTFFMKDSGDLMSLALLNAAACLFVAGRGRWRLLFFTLLASYCSSVLISLYLYKNSRLPERISYNVAFWFNAICMYWMAGLVGGDIVTRSEGTLRALFAGPGRLGSLRTLTGALVGLWFAFHYWLQVFAVTENVRRTNSTNRDLKQISRSTFQVVDTLLPQGKHPVLIALPFDSLLEESLFYYPSPRSASFSLVPYGWLTHSPIYYQILAQNQLLPNPASLVNRPDVFFLMERRWLEPLRVYYREHKGLDVLFEPVLNTDAVARYHPDGHRIYRAHASVVKEPGVNSTP